MLGQRGGWARAIKIAKSSDNKGEYWNRRQVNMKDEVEIKDAGNFVIENMKTSSKRINRRQWKCLYMHMTINMKAEICLNNAPIDLMLAAIYALCNQGWKLFSFSHPLAENLVASIINWYIINIPTSNRSDLFKSKVFAICNTYLKTVKNEFSYF